MTQAEQQAGPLPEPIAPVAPSAPRQAELAGPTREPERIQTLDVLRGLAILGILLVNVQGFAMPEAALMVPAAYGDLSGANLLAWLGTHLLAQQKFVTLFSMLFGVGVLLMSARRDAAGLPAAGVHYRRMGGLLLFGLAHAYLLWYGDILVAYALLGMVVFWLRRLPPIALAGLGAALYAVPALLMLLVGLALTLANQQFDSAMWLLMPPAEEVAIYRSGWLTQMQHRVPMALYSQTAVFVLMTAWSVSGLMLIGMAVFKWGLLRGTASGRTYRLLLGLAVLVGLPVIGLGVAYHFARGWDLVSIYLGFQFNYWAAPLVTLGWVSATVLVMRAGRLPRLTRALAAVGRLALTNYLAQSLICTLIFYGHGLGLFGHVDRVGQLGVVVAVWAAQLAWSPWWLRRYRFGPAEWLWRAMSYGEAPAMRRAG